MQSLSADNLSSHSKMISHQLSIILIDLTSQSEAMLVLDPRARQACLAHRQWTVHKILFVIVTLQSYTRYPMESLLEEQNYLLQQGGWPVLFRWCPIGVQSDIKLARRNKSRGYDDTEPACSPTDPTWSARWKQQLHSPGKCICFGCRQNSNGLSLSDNALKNQAYDNYIEDFNVPYVQSSWLSTVEARTGTTDAESGPLIEWTSWTWTPLRASLTCNLFRIRWVTASIV